MDDKKFTSGAFTSINTAKALVYKYKLNYVGSEHILYGLLTLPNCHACKCLNQFGVNLKNYFTILKNTFNYNSNLGSFTPDAIGVIDDAGKISEYSKVGYVSTEHLLLAMLKKSDCKANYLLKQLNADKVGMENYLSELVFRTKKQEEEVTEEETEAVETEPKSTLKDSPLVKFGYDLTEKARAGKIDPVIGREREIERIIQSLSRRTKTVPF